MQRARTEIDCRDVSESVSSLAIFWSWHTLSTFMMRVPRYGRSLQTPGERTRCLNAVQRHPLSRAFWYRLSQAAKKELKTYSSVKLKDTSYEDFMLKNACAR